jgi:hypothetical protein
MAVTQTANPPATRAGATTARTEKGISLARGPALILGTILLAAGLYFLYKQHNFPKLSNFPNGDAPVDGKVFGIFGANGWTGMLTAIAGGLLLFGAAQHLVAKTMSLIVGIGLGAAAVIAAISGDVLGLAAANGWTEIAWGACAAILLFNVFVPRRRRVITEEPRSGVVYPRRSRESVAERPVATREPVAAGEPVGAGEPLDTREPVAERETETHEPIADRRPDEHTEPIADRDGDASEPVNDRESRDVSGTGQKRGLAI